MSDVEAGAASAPDPPPPLEAENSLEDVDGDASLLDSPGPGDPDDSLALDDPPLVDAPEPGGTDDPRVETEEGAADVTLEGEPLERDATEEDVSGDAEETTPEDPEGPVEEFPADNTPDVIVTLVILPENFQHVLTAKAMTTGAELKERVVAELPLPYDALSLRHGEEDFPDDVALVDVGIKPGANAELELVVRFAPTQTPEPEPEPVAMPKFIDVAVSQTHKVRVVIDSAGSHVKPRFVGGYRDIRDGTKYHHAQIQTERQTELRYVEKYTTETQTYELRSRTTETTRESSTQMKRPDLMLDDKNDVVVRVGKYVTAEETTSIKAEKAVTLQRFARGARDRRRRDALRNKRDAELKAAEVALETARLAEERKRSFDIERRVSPRTDADFKLLQREFDEWRLKETAKIDAAFPAPVEAEAPESVAVAEDERRRALGAGLYSTATLSVSAAADADGAAVARERRRRAMAELLAKETKMLLAMERLRRRAAEENEKERVRDALEDMAASKHWEKKDGAVVIVDTTQVIRARELRALYEACQVSCSPSERLELLRHLKWTVREFSTKLTKDIAELIDRESDLLLRRRDPATMAGLRKRLSGLFLQFIETPEFNPEASRYSVAALAKAEREAEREAERAARAERIRRSRESRGVYE
jgi:hypothetical protein